MPSALGCQKMSKRYSCSSRGVTVTTGVIQWGCLLCVSVTMSNQALKKPPPDEGGCEDSSAAVPQARFDHVLEGWLHAVGAKHAQTRREKMNPLRVWIEHRTKLLFMAGPLGRAS